MCAQFAPVCPPAILMDMKRRGLLGSYHLLLAHDVAANPEEYETIFRPRGNFYIIMDNSLIELGHPCDDGTMQKAWNILDPDVAVLPDKLCDIDFTIRESFNAGSRWWRLGIDRFLGVVQGTTEAELLSCADQFVSIPFVKALSIPRVVTDKVLGSRTEITQKIHERSPHLSIHLLGFSDNIEDDIKTAKLPFVQGIDSAVPVRAGLLGIEMDRVPAKVLNNLPPRGDFWESAKTLNPGAINNLNYIRHMIAPENYRKP